MIRFDSFEMSCLLVYLFPGTFFSGLSGESYPSIAQSQNENNVEKQGRSVFSSPLLNRSSINKNSISNSAEQPTTGVSLVRDSNITNSLSTLTSDSFPIVKEVQSSNSAGVSEASNISSNRSDLSMNIIDEGLVHDSLDFEQFFQEGYYKASPLSDCRDTAEVITDVDSSSPCDREKSEEDGDNDDMLGGVFAFSEEGRTMKQLYLFDHTLTQNMIFGSTTRNQ